MYRAKQYKVTSFLSTDCELSTNPCSKNFYNLGPWSGTAVFSHPGRFSAEVASRTYLVPWLLLEHRPCTTSPMSSVRGYPLQLLPAQPRLRDVCLKVTTHCIYFWRSTGSKVHGGEGAVREIIICEDSTGFEAGIQIKSRIN